MTRWLAPALATLSFAWCVVVGWRIWITPVGYVGISNGAPAEQSRSFAEISLLGPTPLIVPVLFAALAMWGVWRGRRVVAFVAASLLAAFTFIGGFSIGSAYVPAAALALAAAVSARRVTYRRAPPAS